MLTRKKRNNIFQNKRGHDGTENWVLSDMGSDSQSVGGESHSSYQSFHKQKFKAVSFLSKRSKNGGQ